MTEKADLPLDMAVFCHQSSVLQSLISDSGHALRNVWRCGSSGASINSGQTFGGKLWMTSRYSVYLLSK